MVPVSSSNLTNDLILKKRELITLVGAGGKTTLMYALAKELLAQNNRVVTTTTTKIYPPDPDQSPALFLGGRAVFAEMKTALDRLGHCTWAAGRNANNKLAGVSLSDLSALWASTLVDFLIVEADGSARKPIKAPNADEPVTSAETTLFLTVVGLSALNKPLNSENAFRPEIISRLIGLPLQAPMTLEAMAQLLVHPQGGLKGWLPGMRAVAIVNQADSEDEPGAGKRLADRIEDLGKGRISQVLLRGKNPPKK